MGMPGSLRGESRSFDESLPNPRALGTGRPEAVFSNLAGFGGGDERCLFCLPIAISL